MRELTFANEANPKKNIFNESKKRQVLIDVHNFLPLYKHKQLQLREKVHLFSCKDYFWKFRWKKLRFSRELTFANDSKPHISRELTFANRDLRHFSRNLIFAIWLKNRELAKVSSAKVSSFKVYTFLSGWIKSWKK